MPQALAPEITIANIQAGRVTNGMLADANISVLQEQLPGRNKSRVVLVPASDYPGTREALQKGRRFGVLTNYRTKELVVCPKEYRELLRDLIGTGSADEYHKISRQEADPYLRKTERGEILESAAVREHRLGMEIRFRGFRPEERDAGVAEDLVKSYQKVHARANARRMANIAAKLRELARIPITDVKFEVLPDRTVSTDVSVQVMKLKLRGIDEKINM